MSVIYKAGGKVTVTLKDGTRVFDSPISSDKHGNLYIVNGALCLPRIGGTTVVIASVDDYTPPLPEYEWNRPEVRVIVRQSDPDVAMFRSINATTGDVEPGLWRIGTRGTSYTTEDLAKIADDWVVHAVIPPGSTS